MISRNPTGTTNELAKQRNREAAERTLTSWIQNCLSLIGFGTAFVRISSAVGRVSSSNRPIIDVRLAHLIGLNAIAIGIFLLFIAVLAYLSAVKSLQSDLEQLPRLFYPTLIGSVILLGIVTSIICLIVPY